MSWRCVAVVLLVHAGVLCGAVWLTDCRACSPKFRAARCSSDSHEMYNKITMLSDPPSPSTHDWLVGCSSMFYLEIDFQGHSIKKQLTATRLETQQLQLSNVNGVVEGALQSITHDAINAITFVNLGHLTRDAVPDVSELRYRNTGQPVQLPSLDRAEGFPTEDSLTITIEPSFNGRIHSRSLRMLPHRVKRLHLRLSNPSHFHLLTSDLASSVDVIHLTLFTFQEAASMRARMNEASAITKVERVALELKDSSPFTYDTLPLRFVKLILDSGCTDFTLGIRVTSDIMDKTPPSTRTCAPQWGHWFCWFRLSVASLDEVLGSSSGVIAAPAADPDVAESDQDETEAGRELSVYGGSSVWADPDSNDVVDDSCSSTSAPALRDDGDVYTSAGQAAAPPDQPEGQPGSSFPDDEHFAEEPTDSSVREPSALVPLDVSEGTPQSPAESANSGSSREGGPASQPEIGRPHSDASHSTEQARYPIDVSEGTPQSPAVSANSGSSREGAPASQPEIERPDSDASPAREQAVPASVPGAQTSSPEHTSEPGQEAGVEGASWLSKWPLVPIVAACGAVAVLSFTVVIVRCCFGRCRSKRQQAGAVQAPGQTTAANVEVLWW
ncbi:Uncharacterized protein PBTT_08756 [Plasmodiophora brassicae]|uniref:Uncharacterized protein n=1 Tax=Plasmodiophora brassicae TaxID=37360 RepID=A0A0G4INQ7_PLABS|nr:hypothetical protein PBRA_005404 [Plasmodiophora brassicae]SPR00661.1 unnamed protein product [Plasmodiophora brassicae]